MPAIADIMYKDHIKLQIKMFYEQILLLIQSILIQKIHLFKKKFRMLIDSQM